MTTSSVRCGSIPSPLSTGRPEPPEHWPRTQTANVIKSIFPMFHLTVDGIEQAVSALIGARRAAAAG